MGNMNKISSHGMCTVISQNKYTGLWVSVLENQTETVYRSDIAEQEYLFWLIKQIQ